MSRHAFVPVGPDEVRWHDELPWHPGKADLFWIDGALDSGHHIGIGLLRSRPLVGGLPAVTITILPPDGEVVDIEQTIAPDDFESYTYGARWADIATLVVEVDDEGSPLGFTLSVSIGGDESPRVELEVEARAVCVGSKFVDRSPGFTAHDEASGSAAGWWPLIPRAASTGRMIIDDTELGATGAFHIERQVSSFPLGGSAGEKSAQSIWSWGHLYAGDHTALWTDSASSEHFGHHHFTPFLLWQAGEPLVQTFAFASYVERFEVSSVTGLARPSVTTLKASDGTRDVFARLVDPRFFTHVELNGRPGSIYCRMLSRVAGRIDDPDGTERFTGHAVHEWGTQAGNFPFPGSESGDGPLG